ncbi:phosphatidylserine decarboxylase family protein [Cupriavidus pauculus]|uniref:phosphatidylserine decarboxylase family protein n=1 Tax=Cupriavidus pauculus TaxID=82633 RepID=UPI0007813534|nr:phosphatidylserine decarboxylase family protein [Cupriavidus pauculus]
MAIDMAKSERLGDWLPKEEKEIEDFRRIVAATAMARNARWHPETVSFQRLLETNPVPRMELERAIAEAVGEGRTLGYRNRDELLRVVDFLLTYAPPFSEQSMVVCPLNAVLDWLMCMPSGYAFFRRPEVNVHMRALLDAWSRFLSAPESRTHLNAEKNGWLSDAAIEKLGLQEYCWAPGEPYGGFPSWNAFFTRKFRDAARPVASPDDDRVIVNACESTPYHFSVGATATDKFWMKSQPYSLGDMFGHRDQALVDHFTGGTVYQAFLSAFNYHRWHAPVPGTVVHAYLVPGTYYSCMEGVGEDPEGLNDSQGYTTAVATRAVIVIDHGDAVLGQVACLFVGMAEVSSCVIAVEEGQRVEKGQELGHFQYGGSTWCLVTGAELGFDLHHAPGSGEVVRVNASLATLR